MGVNDDPGSGMAAPLFPGQFRAQPHQQYPPIPGPLARCFAVPAAMTVCSTPEAPTYQLTRGLNHHNPELIANAPLKTIAHHSSAS